MGFFSTFIGILGFGIGIPIGLFVGFFLFVFAEPKNAEDPIIQPLYELDTSDLQELMPEIPYWVKHPDYDRVDWLNKFISDMWPYLDKAICGIIRSMADPIFANYVGKFQIKAIEFEKLTLGKLPPALHGIKVYETNEKELVIEPAIRWAGNTNITLRINLLSLPVKVQLADLQVFAAPRIALKPLVPTFPCFASVTVSLMEKPHIDFGMKILGGDVMSIPGLYQFVQETIKKQIASLYLWPQTLEIPILDPSVGAMKKPVGILHVNVIRALKLLKMDLLGTSDPYVKLSLSGERLPSKKTTVKRKNLNPEWNEKFKLIVKDPQAQVLQLDVYDWDKVGTHDHLGMQEILLKVLSPNEPKVFTLDLRKSTNPNDSQNKKPRGQIVVEVTFSPFREENERLSGPLDGSDMRGSLMDHAADRGSTSGAGLLLVTVLGAVTVEGARHNNPYALVLFRGEKQKTKLLRKTRDPVWNEEFQFMVEEPPLGEKIRVEVMSKRLIIGYRSKEALGHVDIDLTDVVNNGRINHKYNLINSRNGVIHVDIRWKTI